MANFSNLKNIIDQVVRTNGQGDITGANLNQTIQLMVTELGANYQYTGVATPLTNPGSPDQNVFYIATSAGTYSYFNDIVLPKGISVLRWNGSWSATTLYTVDTGLTPNSEALVQSGTVFERFKFDGGAWNVSAHFPTGGPNQDGIFTIEYILSHANTYIPVNIRIGGMCIKFVRYSDNRFVQYLLMSSEWSINVTDWQGVDDKPTAGSHNLVESGGVKPIETKVDILNIGVYGGEKNVSTSEAAADYTSQGKLLLAAGTTTSNSSYATSGFIAIDETKQFISLKVKAAMKLNGMGGIVFYNAATVGDTVVGTVQNVGTISSDNEEYTVTSIPPGAKYFRVCSFINTATAGNYELTMRETVEGSIPSIVRKIGDLNSLATESKNNIVAAINEVNGKLPVLGELQGYTDICITNYALLVKIYTNMIINSNGEIVPDSVNSRNCTSLVKLDKGRDMYANTSGGVLVSFYDEQKQFISRYSSIYWEHPLEKSSYPNNAEYVAFTYYRSALLTDILCITNKPTLSRYAYGSIIRAKGTRPVIHIHTSDTQVQILNKLCDAFITEECDVIWEYGTYVFDDIYIYMRDTLGWTWAMGLPVGGKCRYYFNNSTIISNAPNTEYSLSRNVFDTIGNAESFEMHDGIIINNGGTYGIHDEASGGTNPFTHKYENMVIKYVKTEVSTGISQCVGCGFGNSSSYIYDGCIFVTDTDGMIACSFGHGHENSYDKLIIKNCYIVGRVNLMNDLDETSVAEVIYSSNSALTTPVSGNGWNVYAFNNEIRQ